MNENLISWSFTNIVTITLMALIGFFVLSYAAQAYRQFSSN